MINHRNICEKNKATCSYCNKEFIEGNILDHLNNCELNPVKCKLCDALVPKKELEKHREENNFCRRSSMKIKEIESLKQEYKKLKNSNSEQNVKINELQKQNDSNKNNMITLRNENIDLNEQNKELKESEKFQKITIERLTKLNMETEGKLNESNENYEKLLVEKNKILDNLVKENQNLKLEIKNIENDRNYAINQKTRIEIIEEETRKEMSSLISKNNEQSLTIDGLYKRIEDKNQNISDLEKQIKHLNDEVRSLEVIKDKLIKKIKNPEKDGKGNDDDDFEI